jgi:hypothetical protein
VSRPHRHPAPPGGVRITVPTGYESRWLSEPEDRETAERWIWSSPDSCLYHAPAYVEFSRAQNRRADLLWLVRDGNPVLGVPLHPAGDRRFSTAYAGLLFAPGRGEGPLRRGVAAFGDLLQANRGLRLQVLQSPQARSYESPARMAAVARRFDERRLTGPSLYSRILALPEAEEIVPRPDLSPELLITTGLEPYAPKLRNQIRQAARHGLSVTCMLPTDASDIRRAYGDFVPLHRISWDRTGMQPHDGRYWEALSRAVINGGGRDVIVYVRDQADRAIAAVVCHAHEGHALYWAGCSSEDGLRMRANPMCLHAAIQACQQLGVRHFELGRFNAREPSDKERKVTQYKAQFGGDLVRVVGFETGSGRSAVIRRPLAALRMRRS